MLRQGRGGLRERQREQRRERILLAAARLFADRGFDQTGIEDIATAAEVSVTTIYNYFNAKRDLLLGLLDKDRQMTAPRVDLILRDPPADAVDAIVSALIAGLENGYDISQKRVWREISAASLRGTRQQRQDFLEVQRVRGGFLVQLLRELKRRGHIAAGVNIDSAARVLTAVSRNCFRLYLMRDEATVADLKRMVTADVRTTVNGLGAAEISPDRQLAVCCGSRRAPLFEGATADF